jgi:drug/metabolite transporter (DMT)-like permease
MLMTDGMPTELSGVGSALYVGMFEMGVTYMFWLSAMKVATHASRVSNLIFLSPFLSLIFIHYILGEELSIATFVGLAMIVSAVAVQQYAASRKDATHAVS